MKKGGGIGTSKPKKESPKTESPKTKKKRKNVSFPDDPVTQIHNLSPQEKLEFHKKNKTNIHEPKTRKEKLAAKRVRQKILVDLENQKYLIYGALNVKQLTPTKFVDKVIGFDYFEYWTYRKLNSIPVKNTNPSRNFSIVLNVIDSSENFSPIKRTK